VFRRLQVRRLEALREPVDTYDIIEHGYDVVIVGASGAGLRAALGMVASGLTAACVTKVSPTHSHTVAAGTVTDIGNGGASLGMLLLNP
jgi:ribulose 1,5-bisphosphate synthetase/thiazole synthase